MKAKAYCECKSKANEYYGLFAPGKTKKGGYQFVHPCGRPTEEVWRAWLERCPECWVLFSSPWSLVCRTCHREQHGPGATFRGWAWARKKDQEFRQELLDAGNVLRYAQEVEGQTPCAPNDRSK